MLLRQRAGHRAIASYEAEHGQISQEALAEADRRLDQAGALLSTIVYDAGALVAAEGDQVPCTA